MPKRKQVERSVFLSYRRTTPAWALAIYQNLTQHGFDVFFDFEGLGSGDFAQQIINNIHARAHFIVLLTPSALERCKNPGDWLRREIETALESRRNIVPITLEDFDFGDPNVARRLTGKLESLKHYNALSVPVGYFAEAMKKLRERYLNVPLDAVLHPASSSTLQLSAKQQAAALNAPLVPEDELAAEEWFERGYSSSDLDEKIRYFDQAIKVKPDYGPAYIFRGIAHARKENNKAAMDDLLKGASISPKDAWGHYGLAFCCLSLQRYDDAIAQMDEAIRLDPTIPDFYFLRAESRVNLGDLQGADGDYSELIRLVPDDEKAQAYCSRGKLRLDNGDFKGAMKDCTETIRLNPKNELAYVVRGMARTVRGDPDGGISDFDKVIELLPDFGYAYFQRGRARFNKADLDGAISDFDEAIRLDPEFAKAYFNRGVVMEDRGKYDDAIADLERYLALGGGVQNGDQAEVKKRIRTLSKKAGKSKSSLKPQTPNLEIHSSSVFKDENPMVRVLEGHSGPVWSVAFSPKRVMLASGAGGHGFFKRGDNHIYLWKVPEGNLLFKLEGHDKDVVSVALSPDGSILSSGSSDKTVRLWNVHDRELLCTLEGHKGNVQCVAFSPDGAMLASGSLDNTVRLWSVTDGKILRTLNHPMAVNCLAFSPNAPMIASGGGMPFSNAPGDTDIFLWSISDGKILRRLSEGESKVHSVAFSPDGAMLASGLMDRTVCLWSIRNWKLINILLEHKSCVTSVAFSPDGAMLASGCMDKTIRLWSVPDGKLLRALEGHNHSVSSVAFSPDGAMLASGSQDKTARLWPMQ